MLSTTSHKIQPSQHTVYRSLNNINGTDEIRILELLPGRDEIRCNLNYVRLSESPKYEALSYCWGSSEHTRSIVLDEKPFPVTENLYAALKRLRLTNASRLLWIDAICINQSDNDERSQQVRIMVQIYRRGVRTVVWLGEENERTAKTMKLLNFMACHSIDHADNSMGYYGLRELLDEKEPSLSKQAPEFPALITNLSRLPWFSRAWVVQEVAVSNDISVRWGSHEFSWTLFEKVQSTISFSLTRDLSALIELRIAFLDNMYDTSLQNTIIEHMTREATDIRDKIYALLGLLSRERHHGLEPDYNKDSSQVLAEFTIACLRSNPHLTILSFARGCRSTTGEQEGPSWLIQINPQSDADTEASVTFGWNDETRGKLFQASKGSHEESLEVDLQRTTLIVSGFELDSVCEVCSAYYDSTFVDEQNNPDPTMGDQLRMVSQFTVLLVRWCEMFGVQRGSHPTSRSMREKMLPLWEITCCMSKRLFTDADVLQEAFLNYIALYRYFRYLPRFNGRDILILHSILWVVLLCYCRVSSSFFDQLELGSILDWIYQAFACNNRRMFKTSGGHMGLAPLWTRKNDRVFLLKGARVPFILRKHGEDWLLVGEAYMDGVMNGEAWDESKCSRLRIK